MTRNRLTRNHADVWLTIGGIFGFLGVALGAFGAHGLAQHLSPSAMDVFHTGVLYHLVHAAALLAVGSLAAQRPSRVLSVAGWGFAAGTVLFSGSLYALAVSGVRWIGMITPFGGVAFLIGWLALAVAGSTRRRA